MYSGRTLFDVGVDLIKLPEPRFSQSLIPNILPHAGCSIRPIGFDVQGHKKPRYLIALPLSIVRLSVIRFLTEAAYDPKVDEIKITQYRVAEESAVVNALITAAKNGKRVTVFVELKARFDEENNIATSERMKKYGIKIIYSTPGLKVHAKVALNPRRSERGENIEKSFAYLSTGNFNEKTAKIYSDMGLFTYNTALIQDLNLLFNILEGKTAYPHFEQLIVSPFNMLSSLKRKNSPRDRTCKTGKTGISHFENEWPAR